MSKRIKSILDELEDLHHKRDSKHIIESRAESLITNAIRLIELIEDTYTTEEAQNLTRKLLNSIKLRDMNKFKRSMRRINESKK